jgi:acetyl-CoA decarbonylase/synthase complex subunit gamma
VAAAWLRLFPAPPLAGAGLAMVMTAIVSFMTLTFTGSTTFTTLSGVRLETRYAVPAQLSAAGAGVLCSLLAIWT